MRYVNLVMYVLLFGAITYIALMEHADWFCDSLHGLTFDECKGEGLAYRGSTASDDDSINTLLTKIDIGSQAEKNSIKWRRAAVLSTAITLAMFALICTPGTLPAWDRFYTSVLIGFAILYFMLNFYSYHYNIIPEKNIRESIKLIKDRLGVK